MAVGWNGGRWLFPALATCKEKDHKNKEKSCDVRPVTKPSVLLRDNTALALSFFVFVRHVRADAIRKQSDRQPARAFEMDWAVCWFMRTGTPP